VRAEVVSSDETLQRLFAIEIEKAGVVTHQGFQSVYAYFLQSQVVTDAVQKREVDKKRNDNKKQNRRNANPLRVAADNLRKSACRQILPVKDESANQDEVNIALRRSVILSEDEHEEMERYNRNYQKKIEEQRLVDSFLASYKSRDEGTDHQIPLGRSTNTISSRHNIEVNEIVVADTAFKRTNSSSSLQLRDIFEEIDSDDETLSTSNSASDREAKKMSSKGNNGWLPWPKKNDGNNLLVSSITLEG
jgi:hypothetical protein